MRTVSAKPRGTQEGPSGNAREGLRRLIEGGDDQTVAIIDGAMAAVLKQHSARADLRDRLTARLARLDVEEVVHILSVHQRIASTRSGESVRV
ncbi:MAG: hypothetical protein WCK05_16490 [Planctomycetota bacterium]